MTNKFKELRQIDVSQYTEKKGKFTYLSWAWAVDQLLQHDDTATFNFRDPSVYPDGTMMIWCDVTAFNKTMTGYLPVIDHRNQPIKNPNSMAINTAMQRCLAKTIALFGIGLYIYAGEDIPAGDALELIKKTYEEQGLDGARALFNKMGDEDRKLCMPFIEEIKKGRENGTKN